MSTEPTMRDVSDTALGVAVERARETERRRPLFRDPHAELLAGERPRCRLERVGVDLTDAAARHALLDQTAALARPTLVVSEGVVVYLRAEDVVALARDLAGRTGIRWWALDVVGARFVEWGRRIVGRQ